MSGDPKWALSFLMTMSRNSLKAVIFTGLFLIPFVPFLVSSSLFFPFITTKAFAFRTIVEVIFATWALLALTAPEYRLKKSYIVYALGAFLLVVGLADLFGNLPLKSFWSNYERMEGFVTLLHLGALFVVFGTVFKEIDWKRWWNTSLVASFLMVIYAFFQLAGVATIHQGGARVDGSLGNASYLAVYLLIHIFVALLFLYRERKNSGLLFLYGALALSQTYILYETATRGAILGFIGGLLLLALLNVRNKENLWMRRMSLWLLGLVIVVVGSVALLRNTAFVRNSLTLSRFTSISTEELRSGGRSFVWPMALKGIKEKPILGWGQDNFGYVFQKYYSPEMYKVEPWFDRAHNIFLDWAVSGGLLGLLAYLLLYVAYLWLIWKKQNNFSYEERSILTALLAAYFFHNLFVFDQLVSYILFIALLGYVHSRSAQTIDETKTAKDTTPHALALPVALILLSVFFYFITLKPIRANITLIQALGSLQGGNVAGAVSNFEKAYNLSYLGRSETVEQIALATPNILSSSLSTEEKNAFYRFAKEAVLAQSAEARGDARTEIVTGAFLTQTGDYAGAIEHLTVAEKLSPGKQTVYFELGSALINKGDIQGGLAAFKKAYDLAPEYLEAQKIYLVGAIYAGNRTIEQTLRSQIPEKDLVFDDRLISAYYSAKRYGEIIAILERRIALDPANAATYQDYIKQVRAL